MTSSETEITTLNRKRGNIKCQLTKMVNALQKQTDLSIPELQTKLDIVLKLQGKFELLKNVYYTNETEYADAEPVLNSMEDDLQDFENCPIRRTRTGQFFPILGRCHPLESFNCNNSLQSLDDVNWTFKEVSPILGRCHALESFNYTIARSSCGPDRW
ncbi:uncharacterized protein TNCV_102461 [Trichonephila clavipes]|nr:uncharacterized protein TNCV_102461 [Trichonephila clavipes]